MNQHNSTNHQTEEKPLDSTAALQRVIRLDKKHTNFDYFDPIRSSSLRIAYPNVSAQGPSSQLLLKNLWKHINSYYFKDIDENDFERLNYIETILNSQFEGRYRFSGDEDFWETIGKIFTQEYVKRYLNSSNKKTDYHNWLEYMYICWKITSSNDVKQVKKMINNFQMFKQEVSNIYERKQSQKVKLNYERKELSKIVKAQLNDEQDEVNMSLTKISQQIQRLQQDIKEINNQSRQIFMQLKRNVQKQLIQSKFIAGGQQTMEDQSDQVTQFVFNEKDKIAQRLKKAQYFDIQSKYIQYQIRQLQKKQIAESISKLYRVQKTKGQVKIQLFFEQSMGIKPIMVTEKQFQELNSLRQYSLLKFYNTATKSRYSFICQNYLGFKDIFENRTKPCKLKNKDIFDLMIKTPSDSLGSSYYKQFTKMEICHHCKLLYSQSSINKCQYNSNKHGEPIPLSPYYDSYLHQILKNDQSKLSSIRYLNNNQNRKNSYFQYTKNGEECVCDRRFCKYCLRNYEQNRQKNNGLCPYCRGICFCTRCSRNDMIVRLKSMYALIGGDITKIQKESWFEKYYTINEQQMDLRKKQKSSKNSKRFLSPSKVDEKMLNVRYQLQDLRIICDLVKRRQKHKQKKLLCKKQIFRGKISRICPDISFVSVQKSPQKMVQPQISLNQIQNKKLKRMIA